MTMSKNKDTEKQSTDWGKITWGEIERLEKAAEAGDLEAQKRLTEFQGTEFYEDFTRTFQEIAKLLVDNKDIQIKLGLDGMDARISKALQGTVNPFSETINNIFKEQNYFLAPIYPSAEERLANEIAQNNFLQREVLDEMRKQKPESSQRLNKPVSESPAEKSMALPSLLTKNIKLAFDVLDAATERSLLSHNIVKINRTPITSGSIAYDIYENELGYLGKVIIRKTGDKKSEIEVRGSSLPDGYEVIKYYYHQSALPIEGGYYDIDEDAEGRMVHESDLIPQAEEFQQKRHKYLLDVVIPTYFECLQRLEEDSAQVGAGKTEKQQPEYKAILAQLKFEDTTGWDMILIQMWNEGYSCVDVATRANVTIERAQNRKSEIRRILGKINGYIVLPKEKDRKAQMVKSRYTA
jgi:hypothetical protein